MEVHSGILAHNVRAAFRVDDYVNGRDNPYFKPARDWLVQVYTLQLELRPNNCMHDNSNEIWFRETPQGLTFCIPSSENRDLQLGSLLRQYFLDVHNMNFEYCLNWKFVASIHKSAVSSDAVTKYKKGITPNG